MFKFKKTSAKTLDVMSEVAKGNIEKDYEESCIDKVRDLTKKDFAKITSSGNNSIFIALSAIEGDIIIPDQGGWHGFKQIAKFLNKDIITLKTDSGIINTDYLDELEVNDNSALIFTSFAGYAGEQDVKDINRHCHENDILTIEDASAGIGDKEKKLGILSDIILASTGSPKMINVGSGGILAADNEEIFKNTKLPQKLSETSQIVCSGIDSEIDNVEKNLEITLNATDYVKKHIPNALHENKRGVNVIIPHDDAKPICWNLKKELITDKSGMVTTCPNYNRIKQKAICIEIKNLDYSCLDKKNLDIIIDAVNSQL